MSQKDKNHQDLTEIRNVIRSEDILLLLYILKNSTDYDHALSVHQVTDLLNMLIPSGDMDQDLFSDRTIRRKLELLSISEDDLGEDLKNRLDMILTSLTGGSVKYRAADGIDKGINQTGAGTQKRFYFEPVSTPEPVNPGSSSDRAGAEDGISYPGAYPATKAHRKSKKVDCRFECTGDTLRILRNYFGADIHTEESNFKHSEDELTDQNGEPRRFLIATVRDVQWEKAVDFCLDHLRFVTLLEPSEMVDEIRKQLKTIRKKYKSKKS